MLAVWLKAAVGWAQTVQGVRLIMTTITLEVPDELAAQIEAMRDDLPALLAKVLAGKTAGAIRAGITYPVYREMLDFLASQPAPEQILAFQLSLAVQERLADLLEKNREEELSEAEVAELDVYELVHHSVIRLKAQARAAQA